MRFAFGLDDWLVFFVGFILVMLSVLSVRWGDCWEYGLMPYQQPNGRVIMREDRTVFDKKKWWRSCATILTVGYLLTNVMTWWLSSSLTEDTPSVTTADVAASFGLTDGVSYPLMDGSSGAVASPLVTSGQFIFEPDLPPSDRTEVVLGFEANQKEYLLTLPKSRITFKRTTIQQPQSSVVVSFEHTTIPASHWKIDWRPCPWLVDNLFLRCNMGVASKTLTVDSATQAAGLNALVASELASATLTLTPAAYAALTPES